MDNKPIGRLLIRNTFLIVDAPRVGLAHGSAQGLNVGQLIPNSIDSLDAPWVVEVNRMSLPVNLVIAKAYCGIVYNLRPPFRQTMKVIGGKEFSGVFMKNLPHVMAAL